ncbi:sulfotransferase 2A1-like [Sarcophilus harrisii]
MENSNKFLFFKGVPLLSHIHDVEHIQRMQDEFEFQDEDVIVMTYPKSGTHWMIHILSLIYSKGDPTWVKSVPSWKRSNLKVTVEKVCQFLGKELSEEEINSVMENASFQVMKNHILENKELVPAEDMKSLKIVLMRKGICGDWKNHFTVTQMETFNKQYQEKMKGMDQNLFPWDQC